MSLFDDVIFDGAIFDTGGGGGASGAGQGSGVGGTPSLLQRRRRRRDRHASTLSPSLVEALRRYLELRLAS
jgi:hypothetical protein